jgi:hypothetical protein
MGKSNRFGNKPPNVPGPGNYNIPGFADEVLKKAGKNKQHVEGNKSDSDRENSKSRGNSVVKKKNSEVTVMMDLLDYDGSRIDHSVANVSEDEGN